MGRIYKNLRQSKDKVLYYEKDTVDKYGWETIFRKNIYNKKYLFTIEQLDHLNWTITYEGNWIVYRITIETKIENLSKLFCTHNFDRLSD